MRKLRAIAVFAALSTLTLLVGVPVAGADHLDTYTVTITNLTEGQPLTPALVATHKGSDGLFTVGKAAGFGLKEIAENGNLDPMVDRVSTDPDFADLAVVPGNTGVPPVMPGETVTFHIGAASPYNFLSWASMLICTNDGFTGVDALKLPKKPGGSVTAYTQAYDAGTEINTEDFADIVPPCGPLTGQDSMGQGSGMSDPGLAEGEVITHHGGILGIADLDPMINDWVNPVARITVELTG